MTNQLKLGTIMSNDIATAEIHVIVDSPDSVLEMPILDIWVNTDEVFAIVGNALVSGIYTGTLEWYETDSSDMSAKDVQIVITDALATFSNICCKGCVRV